MSLINQAASNYQFYATNNPFLTNSVTGFLIASCGDLICQKVFDSWEKKSAREKRAEQMSIGYSAVNNPDCNEVEKVQHTGMKTIRSPLKFSDTNKGSSSETKAGVQRNIFQRTLFKNKIKKSVQAPAVTRQLMSSEEVEKPFKWDSVRTIHLGVIRALVIAPFVQWWYPVMVRVIPGRSALAVLGRVVMDQISGSPLVVVMVFMASAILQGHPLSSFQRIKEIGFSTWLRGLQYWPFVHAIMHRFVPIQHQTLFAHFCSLYWNAVLSYYVNLKIE